MRSGKRARIWLAATAAALLAVTATACGGGSDNSDSGGSTAKAKPAAQHGSIKGAKVTMWIMNNGPHPVEDTQKILKPFEAKTGVNVDVKLVGWDVQLDRIRNAAISGTGPDITQAGTTQVPFFAALGGFEDLSKWQGEIGGEKGYAPGIWKTTQVVGKDGTWGIPWFTEARAIYYRTDLLQKAGVDPATAFTNWDAFKATLDKLQAAGGSVKPFGAPGKKAFDLVHNVAPFIWAAGGSELNDDATQSTINSPESAKGVQFYADLVHSPAFDKSMLEKDGQGVEDAFKGGKLAVWVGGPWVLGSIPRKDDKIWDDTARANIGIAPLPQGPSGKAYTFVGGSNLMMFKNAKNKDAAWAVIKYLSEDATQKDYADLLGMFPARLGPQEQVGSADANHGKFLEAIKNGRSYAPIPQWAQVETAYKNSFGDILDLAAGAGGGPYTPQAVQDKLNKAADEADGLLAQGAG
jgi:multiple sugar transport system substrate-binding protein